jgi:hypothetical protein
MDPTMRKEISAIARTGGEWAPRGSASDTHTYPFTFSVNSIDDMLALDVPEDASEAWKQELGDRMEEIIDRKRSSVQGREVTLAQYAHILMSHYAFEEIQHKASELFPAFLKSIKAENTEKETCLALRGLLILLFKLSNSS